MSRPRTSRARWDARAQVLVLPLPERFVIRAAAQLGRPGLSGVEALGAWLRRFVLVAAMKPRGRPRGNLRTANGRLLTLTERELTDQLAQMKKKKITNRLKSSSYSEKST